MNYSSLFLFFFGAIGVFNCFLICLYFLFIKKPKQEINILFGLFLFFISERSFRSLIYFYSESVPSTYSSAFGPVNFLFIGPFLLFYLLAVINPDHRSIKTWKYHVIFWLIVAILIHVIFPFNEDPLFFKKYILKLINLQWLIYVIIGIVAIQRHVKKNNSTENQLSHKQKWAFVLGFSVLILWFLFFFIGFSYFVVGSIAFSIIFYTLFLYFLINKKERTQVFNSTIKYLDKKIDSSQASKLRLQLETLMHEQKPYKNPKLKLENLATDLGISKHNISQFLNDNLGKSFSLFINEYRIEEAKRLILSNSHFTLEAIGQESGFNSKSTFYTTFKRLVGLTPAAYKSQSIGS